MHLPISCVGVVVCIGMGLLQVAGAQTMAPPAPLPVAASDSVRPVTLNPSALKVNVTQQAFNARLPWQKLAPISVSGVGVLVADNKVLVTASLVLNARHIEFEKPRTGQRVGARVARVDHEANLALLEPAGEAVDFMQGLSALALDTQVREGDPLELWQLGRTGDLLTAPIVVSKASVARYLLPSSQFLTLEAYGILRAETNSVTLPVVKAGRLAGMLLRYDARNQSLSLIPAAIIQQFLNLAQRPTYPGFPSVGLVAFPTLDPQFRDYLGLNAYPGGVYVGTVVKGSSGQALGIEVGDILLSVNGKQVDSRGDVLDPLFGPIHYTHPLRGQSYVGDVATVEVLRDGRRLALKGPLTAKEVADSIVPYAPKETGPQYIVYGGLIFQELNITYLQSFGEDWANNAPQRLVQIANDPEGNETQGLRRIVVLTGVIPVNGTQGYESLSGLRITRVNGKAIKDLQDVRTALDQHSAGLQRIEFEDPPYAIYLDAAQASADNKFLQGNGYRITQLSRVE